MNTIQRTTFTSSLHQQRGISLFVVIVVVLLSMLLALWAARTSLFNEMVVGNDADYQRAYEAAQALVQDAEFDIQGIRADGLDCAPVAGKPAICRVPNAAVKVWFPTEDADLVNLLSTLNSAATSKQCLQGICLKRTAEQDFWNDKSTLNAMIAEGARYGQYTGAETGASNSKASSTILKNTTSGEGGWYWIEVMPYDSNAGNSALISNGSNNLALNLVPNVAYRITAVARGLKANTQVVLQTTYVRQKKMN